MSVDETLIRSEISSVINGTLSIRKAANKYNVLTGSNFTTSSRKKEEDL